MTCFQGLRRTSSFSSSGRWEIYLLASFHICLCPSSPEFHTSGRDGGNVMKIGKNDALPSQMTIITSVY